MVGRVSWACAMSLLLGLCIQLAQPVVALAGTPPPFVRQWGSFGSAAGQFMFPYGIAVAPSGNVYVTDQVNNRVEVFAPDGSFINQFGSYGTGLGQFSNPYGIAVDPAGTVYVVDRENGRIQKFAASGAPLAQWDGSDSPLGAFALPLGIAVEADGSLLITDAGRNLVFRYTNDGHYLAYFGDASFDFPEGIAVEHGGQIYVTNQHGVTKHLPSGELIGQMLFTGGPSGLAVDQSDNLYVVEHNTQTVYKYSSGGVLLTQWGSFGTGPGEFDTPANVALDQYGFVYVSDLGNSRVQVFGDSPTPAANATWGQVKDRYRK